MRNSLKSRILFGTLVWTAGLFTLSVFTVHFILPPPSGHWYIHFIGANQGLLVIIASVLMLVGFFHVRRGMLPVNKLRRRLTAIHKGENARVDGEYPAEVQPLVDDLNTLLDERERRIKRAIAKAGDLAHGLKTPLAVLVYEAQQVRRAGLTELADDIEHQLSLMQRQIEYHLVHARAAGVSANSTETACVAESAQGLVRALHRAHSERELQIEIESAESHVFRGTRADLDEMLGNLLDNAFKWAKARVRLLSRRTGETIEIVVDDDGPGIEPSMRENVIRRGIRSDEASGSGLGLAIVQDLAEIHGGSISLAESPLGGARALLTLPAGLHQRQA